MFCIEMAEIAILNFTVVNLLQAAVPYLLINDSNEKKLTMNYGQCCLINSKTNVKTAEVADLVSFLTKYSCL